MEGSRNATATSSQAFAAKGRNRVKEVARSNDPVRLSFLTALLADAGLTVIPLDTHASIVQGSLGVIPQRLMVVDDEFNAAVEVLRQAGEWHEPNDADWPFG
jgi:hypothetical protein